jgi:hypothetical protein
VPRHIDLKTGKTKNQSAPIRELRDARSRLTYFCIYISQRSVTCSHGS